ncbi:hypothetical protein PF005_g5774 [Phytophthora fragariae]|uniref:RxLR effector protein n=1 Tax=Phytophthora fragariae TaxID=53985 RepID=A0A6A3ZZA9_9STRA|nr:hypothetical protein PF003_g39812 [Phytophthora fragariae]KAE8943974.1 hypothetical protein PF009_g6299 [Phytophthora fragariae]KAE9021617.1 hypothetical protein PF011_g4844 [Phytophthora fragariae]KAE9097766.1 hypothetical protein PF010_g15828 [Phytophthora fragariae]KAE9126929.1 hypothetical protein PF007_g5781 [Phytophthora fragariae]
MGTLVVLIVVIFVVILLSTNAIYYSSSSGIGSESGSSSSITTKPEFSLLPNPGHEAHAADTATESHLDTGVSADFPTIRP